MFEIINEKEEILELKKVEEFIKFVIEKESLQNCSFSIIITDNTFIHKLNKEYRNVDRPTDVISFALEDSPDDFDEFRMLGDIFISIPKMQEQAREYGHSEKRELSFLVVHGLLHLLGYDHMKSKEDEKIMFDLQDEILESLNILR